MINILVRKPDGGIIIVIPNHDKYGDEEGKRPFSECRGLARYIDDTHPEFDMSMGVLPWELIEQSDIPSKEGLDSRRQLIWKEDGNGKITYRRDESWECRVMCCDVLKKKHIKRLNKQIDSEHEKDAPDIVKISKAMREKEKCKDWSELEWYKHAIKQLDDRVSSGESDKPLIRQKLNDKIYELSEVKDG